jgi:preprotein translocase subunit SecA
MYKERRRVLDGENMRDSILNMMDKVVSDAVAQVAGDGLPAAEWDMKELNQILLPKIPMAKVALTEEEKAKNDLAGFTARVQELGHAAYAKKEAEFGEHFIPEYFRELERIILLKVIDRKWMSHIDDMDQLRQGVGLQAYGQKDPVVQYKFLGYDMFDELIRGINEDTITGLMHLRIEQHVEREQVAKVTGTNKDDSLAKGPYVRKEAKVGRNDPCPCGSGKKYKQCCGRNA